MRKGLEKRLVSLLLAFAMVFTGIGLGGWTPETVKAATVKLQDSEFAGDLSKDKIWTVTPSSCENATFEYYTYANNEWIKTGENQGATGFHFWMGNGGTLSLTQVIESLPRGLYKITADGMGEKAKVSLVIGENQSTAVALSGFNTWDNFEGNFEVKEDALNVQVGFYITIEAGGYGYLDSISIESVTAEDGYSVELTTDADNNTVEAGETVQLSAVLKQNGYTVTDLESSEVKVEYWADIWEEHADGNTDAVLDSTTKETLSTSVLLPTAGTYYIVFSVYDTSWTTLASACVTLTAIDPVKLDEDVVEGDLNITKVPNLADDFIMGMDISSVMSEFASGVTFKDDKGNTINNITDFCKFLKANGITHIRVRVWNDPYDSSGRGYGGGNNDVAKAKQLADGCRAAGLKMLVDFHCSDLWTDPGKQQSPKAWEKYSVSEKEDALKEFIINSLNTIDKSKDVVAMVQVGNETTSGFVGETDKANMCTLFNAGSAGVREYNSSVKVVIHLTNPEKGNMTAWAKILRDNNVDYDILATSYYPYWHGTLDNLKSQFETVKDTYNKAVMVAETSYAYTLEDSDGHDNTVRVGNNDTGGYITEPFTVQGQATSIRNLIAAVSEAGGIGVYYWEPAWVTVGDTTGLADETYEARVAANKKLWEENGSGWASSYAAEYDAEDAGKWYGGSAVDNEAMFYPDGSPTAALHVWNYVKTGAVNASVSVDSIESVAETVYEGESYTLPSTINVSYNVGTVAETVTWNGSQVERINTGECAIYKVSGTISLSKNVNSGAYRGITSVATTYTLTVIPENLIANADDAGFEKGSNFTIGGSGIDSIPFTKENQKSGKGCVHWYNATATNGTVKYNNVISLEAGKYTFELYAEGESGDQVSLQILDEEESVLFEGETVEMDGWNSWKKVIVTYSLEESASIKLQFTVNMKAGGWGTADEMYLHRFVELKEVSTATTIPSTGSGGSSWISQAPTMPVPTVSTETLDNGTVITTETISNTDGSSIKTVTETETDGRSTETKTEMASDGTVVKVTITETEVDGSSVEQVRETITNTVGNEVEVMTTTKRDSEGIVLSVTEKSVFTESVTAMTSTVTVNKDGEGEIVSAKAVIEVIVSDNSQKSAGGMELKGALSSLGLVLKRAVAGDKATLYASVVKQIVEAAQTEHVKVTLWAKDEKGSTRYKVKADTENLQIGEKLYLYKLNTKTGKYSMVDAKTYTVNKRGNVSVAISKKATYELMNAKNAAKVNKEIKATIVPKKTSVNIKKGKTAMFVLSGKADTDNIQSITYFTTKKSVVTVSKNGKITAKGKGTATVKAKVTLKNGETKAIKMNVIVK